MVLAFKSEAYSQIALFSAQIIHSKETAMDFLRFQHIFTVRSNSQLAQQLAADADDDGRKSYKGIWDSEINSNPNRNF